MSVLQPEFDALAHAQPLRICGRVATLRGLTLLVNDLPLPVGSLVRVGADTAEHKLGEVVGFDQDRAIVMLLHQTGGIRPGDTVSGEQIAPLAPVGASLLGRVVDALGRPIDARGPIPETLSRPIDPEPLGPMERARITEPLLTGVRAIDLMTPIGRGQRMGVFAGPGVGKGREAEPSRDRACAASRKGVRWASLASVNRRPRASGG